MTCRPEPISIAANPVKGWPWIMVNSGESRKSEASCQTDPAKTRKLAGWREVLRVVAVPIEPAREVAGCVQSISYFRE